MRAVVTGARGFLGSRVADLLEEGGHDVVRVSRPHGASRALAGEAIEIDSGDPAARDLLAGAHAVFHFAGVPDPARSRSDPAWAVRQNAGTTTRVPFNYRKVAEGAEQDNFFVQPGDIIVVP